jgi:hypothetical protein
MYKGVVIFTLVVKALRLALSKESNRVGIFLSSPEDGNRSSGPVIEVSSF